MRARLVLGASLLSMWLVGSADTQKTGGAREAFARHVHRRGPKEANNSEPRPSGHNARLMLECDGKQGGAEIDPSRLRPT
eukprot:15473059-Alexandrium_andersonii.AAC.1